MMRAQRSNQKGVSPLSIAGNAAINSSSDIPSKRSQNREFFGQSKGNSARKDINLMDVMENSYDEALGRSSQKKTQSMKRITPREKTKAQVKQMLSEEYQILNSPTASKSIVPRMQAGLTAVPMQSVAAEQNRARSHGRKLFVQEFYNIKKGRKRDLKGISLHNHPDSAVDGVFQQYKAAGMGEMSPGESFGALLPGTDPSTQRNQIPLKKLKAKQHQYVTEKHGRKAQMPMNQQNLHQGIENNRTIVVLPPSQIRSGIVDLASNSLSSQGNLGRSQQLLLPNINQESMAGRKTELRGAIDGTQSLDPIAMMGREGAHSQMSIPKYTSQAGHPIALRNYGSPSREKLVYEAMQSNEKNSMSQDQIGMGSPLRGSPRNHGGLEPIAREQRFNRMQMDMQRADEDHFYVYKSLQKDTYGQPIEHQQIAYGSAGIYDKGRKSQNQLGTNSLKVHGPHKGGFMDQEDSSRKYRHPELAHKISGAQLSFAEQKLDLFARRAPVFNQQLMNEEEIELNERVQKREPKNVELVRTLQRLKDRQSLFDKSKQRKVTNKTQKTRQNAGQSADKHAEKVFGGSASDQIVKNIVGQYETDKFEEDETDNSLDSDIEVQVSNIQDPVAFQEKLNHKLDQMVDPESIQLFSVDQSKQLYSVITKQQKKQADEQERKEQHYSMKKKTIQPVETKQTTPKRPVKKNGSIKQKTPARQPSKATTVNDISVQQLSNNSQSMAGLSRPDSSKLLLSKGKSLSTVSIDHTSTDQIKSNNQEANQVPQNSSMAKKAKKDTSRPDYFAGKGRISAEGMKKKLEDDLMNNLKLADKMGVFNVLRDMYFDAHQKMQWLEKRRHENKQLNFGEEDDEGQPEFPGYEERLDEIEEEIRLHTRKKIEQDAARSVEVLGEERANFHLREDSNIDLSAIYVMFKQNGLKNFSQQQLKDLLTHGEVIAFMTQIQMQKHRINDGQIGSEEESLVNYIKYLVGESNNVGFEFNREDFSQKHELNKMSLKPTSAWDEYAKQEQNAMKTIANDIIERVDYRTVVKHEAEPISIVRYADNPKFYYFQICQKDSDLAIPLLAKVVNRQLSLMSYQLSLGHIKAFVRTFEFNHEFVNRFLFKNCGMTDQHTEILLNHCSQLKQVISLVFKQEEFGIKSMQAIKPLLIRPKPNDLQVLRIIDCRIQKRVTRELISTLLGGNSLRVLGLVNTKMSDSSMQELAQLVQESRSLRELDISWNLLKPQSYINLINSLGENRLLLSLNLSWNSILDSKETFVEEQKGAFGSSALKEGVIAAMQSSFQKMMGSGQRSPSNSTPPFEVSQQWYLREVTFNDQSTQALDSICSLLKRNKRLQHVQLQGIGLSEMMMVKIANAVTRAKSLTSIHLCSNPGTTARVKEYIKKRVHAMPHRDTVTFPISETLNKLQNKQTKGVLLKQLTFYEEVEGEKPVARESIKIKQNKERKRIFSLANDFDHDTNQDSRMILTRILGHKIDMPGSGQWKMIRDKSEECWVCDQQIYGLVFWDAERISDKAIMSTKRPDQEIYMRQAMNKLHQVIDKDEEDRVALANPRVPIIIGDFTNWCPQPCIDILDFCESISCQFDKQAIIQRMQLEKVLSYKKSDPANFDEEEEKQYRIYIRDFHENYAPESWKNIMQKTLLYKKPHLVNAIDARDTFYHSLFMHPAMFQVGKHEFVIRAPVEVYDRSTGLFAEDNSNLLREPEYFYYSNVSDIRPEDVHPYVKVANRNQAVRVFNKEKSVFQPWLELKPQQKMQAFDIDMSNTKISTGVIKNNPEDLAKTIDLLRDNYGYIVECYLELQYKSVYPFVNKIELANFAEKSKLLDDKLNMANCDLLFVMANDNKKGNIKQKMGLIRSEFIEYLVRLSAFKFINSGICSTFYESVKKVIEDYMKPNFHPMPWQKFRDEELWTLEVNDVFETNLDGVQRLHKAYQTPTQRIMSDKDAMMLLTKDGSLDLTVVQAKYCLSYCKMPFKDEIGEFEKYHKLALVELMELIGRAAKIRFENDDDPLSTKIEQILDMLFPIVGFTRRDVLGGQESESMSDDDY